MPPEAQEALRQVREMVEADQKQGMNVSVETTRIGIEGETRLCVEYKDSGEGARAYKRAEAIVRGVDLVNLVAEPCAIPAPQTGMKKEEENP